MGDYIKLGDLELYRESIALGRIAWKNFREWNWHERKIIGDQFITAVDSVAANIAEGYGRYHYKDRMKFYYNARGSLFEGRHWALVLYERKLIAKSQFDDLIDRSNHLNNLLNQHIKSCYRNAG